MESEDADDKETAATVGNARAKTADAIAARIISLVSGTPASGLQ
jgi:hypothetical protein